jgi:CDP-glucose 4,6-dehydratase
VTGHTGFIGGWLSLWLTRLGANVSGYALAAAQPSMYEAVELCRRLSASQQGDIRDGEALSAFMHKANAEIVFHLAAQPIVRTAHIDPVSTFSTNVVGTANVLEVCRNLAALHRIIVFTTDKVYENDQSGTPFVESDRLGGHDPYSASKVGAEFVAASYRDCYFRRQPMPPAISTCRAGNIIGGGDWAADRLVPDAVRAFQDRRELVVRRPNARRPWQHVLECVRGTLLLAERNHSLDAMDPQIGWNLGPQASQIVPVSVIADHAARLWGGDVSWRHEPDATLLEAEILVLSAQRAEKELGWRCVWNIERTMERTIQWYRHVLDGAPTLELSERQIADYEADVRASAT